VSEYLCNIRINEDDTYIQYCINYSDAFSERSDPTLYKACATMLCDPAPMRGFLLLSVFIDSVVDYVRRAPRAKISLSDLPSLDTHFLTNRIGISLLWKQNFVFDIALGLDEG
jgi:hypothetical protein